LGLLLIGAHPTRPGKNLLGVDEALVAQLDALEINGKDVAKENAGNRVQSWANRLGRPVASGSDTHVWAQAGVQRTLLPGDELTFDTLRAALRGQRTAVETVPQITPIVRMCEIYKKLWKRSVLAGQELAPLWKLDPAFFAPVNLARAA
jgi:hypothetical protein